MGTFKPAKLVPFYAGADTLEAAHENGVIHRDLKPANVKITPEGGVKVLETEVSERELANSPTLLEATQKGMVLGTAAYMSPEQARGREVDKRSDIWSFGLVLFEMLAGRGMFAGKSFTDTLAAVIHQEPTLEELPAARMHCSACTRNTTRSFDWRS